MFKNKEKIMQRVKNMEPGEESPSQHYWCVTCKMLFDIEEPVCPYMPKMCINTPIPVELEGPESTTCLEKFGLFYPTIPQEVWAKLISDPKDTGKKWADAYLEFLDDWKFHYRDEPLQALKSFIITVSGCETAQRVHENEITFIITDLEKIWEQDTLFSLLESALPLLKKKLGIKQNIKLDSLDIIGDMPSGKYYCPMCRKFFQFSVQRDHITCPLMAQKCMATPTDIAKIKYDLDSMVRQYEITPDIYKRFMQALDTAGGRELLENSLADEWGFTIDKEKTGRLASRLGL